ncbi:MAG: hypothetical protein HUK02_01920 [Bacteroidaceae bacterium]|nr:hypothetical protein [Bacteroidaceae bacterium]
MTFKAYRQLAKLIKRNSDLKDKRHPMYEKNKFMKFLAWFMVAYYAALMLLMGVVLPMGLGGRHTAAFHAIDSGFFIILIIDFYTRFILQETPSQHAQPYALLPIRRSFLMHLYLRNAMFSLGNLFWAFFLVPCALVAVMPLLGFWAAVGWLLGYWLLIVANSLIYLFVRALCLKHLLWFLAPLAVHAALFCAMFLPDHNVFRLPFIHFMDAFAHWQLWPYLIVLPIIAFWYWANYHLQMGMVYNEVAKKEDVEMKHVATMGFFDRYGAMGEYLKMETKLRLRNKQVRTSFFIGLGLIVFFSLMQYCSDVYDGSFMKSFICLYNYIILGTMTLTSIMCFEGNYIDGLMARRESIYDLLRAKYYFNCVILLLPLVLTLPIVIIGKVSLLMNLGYMFMTFGVLYPIIFQLAVYNRDTIPLNQKITGKQANMAQNIIAMAVLFVPLGVEKLAVQLMGDVWGYVFLMALGIVGVATHRLWLKNIYQRFMARRHYNMEGFRASRA